jgi:predicted transcriptional regulator
MVLDMLGRLPDDVTYEQIQYHVYVLAEITSGLEEIAAGDLIPHEDVERELRDKWMSRSTP